MREKFKFQPGDVILVKAEKKFLWTNPVFEPFVRGYNHAMFYYDKNSRKLSLIMESSPRGAQINTFHKQAGQDIEVYRLSHQYSEIFAEAVIKAGEKLVDRDAAFYDYFLIPLKAILLKLGRSSRLRIKSYPCYVCSEFVQVCFEEAVNFLEGELLQIYKAEILPHFPSKIMFPADFAEVLVLKKVWEGRVSIS
ncbi:MAG: hypothetical protein COV69_00135 [Parcubacteria group bacterium CG11_big_fil_rev_8_21_14_0_20_39_14]|nr:MAG: hypothetical protein COV69_00135 [Parcubacteria group bacterium CG11_big_fil_rev_8_21_14_0_20_39_14]PIS35275.1 MAG: hypothetical protein COT36_03330 [Parcubacteria group bacterium CG08_land_8_20_14_0_20_38_56]